MGALFPLQYNAWGERDLLPLLSWDFGGQWPCCRLHPMEQTLRDAGEGGGFGCAPSQQVLAPRMGPQRDLSTSATCGVSQDPEAFGGRSINYCRAAINPSSRNLRWL